MELTQNNVKYVEPTQRVNNSVWYKGKVFSKFYTTIECDQEVEQTCESLRRKVE